MGVGIGVRGGAARRNGGAQRAALLTGGAAAVGERSMGGRRGKAAGGMGMEPGAREMEGGGGAGAAAETGAGGGASAGAAARGASGGVRPSGGGTSAVVPGTPLVHSVKAEEGSRKTLEVATTGAKRAKAQQQQCAFALYIAVTMKARKRLGFVGEEARGECGRAAFRDGERVARMVRGLPHLATHKRSAAQQEQLRVAVAAYREAMSTLSRAKSQRKRWAETREKVAEAARASELGAAPGGRAATDPAGSAGGGVRRGTTTPRPGAVPFPNLSPVAGSGPFSTPAHRFGRGERVGTKKLPIVVYT